MKDLDYLIGVDIGASGTKTAIFNNFGNLVAESFEESKLYYPAPRAVEQDINEIYLSVINTIKNCIEISGIDPLKIAAISIDGQMAGVCAIDKNWNAVIPYDSWLDTRCSKYIKILKKEEKEIIKISGGPPTFSHGPKMMWWQNEHPEVFKTITSFIMPAAYVAGKIAGLNSDEAFIDNTYLHFSCFADILNNKWSEDILNNFKFPLGKLPKIIKSYEIIGKVNKTAAQLSGLKEGTPIIAGCGDQAANILGAAINLPGMIFDIAGTASVFSICLNRYVPDIDNRTLFTARTVFDDLWYAKAYINGGGLNLRWFRDEIIKDDKNSFNKEKESTYSIFDNLASELNPGSEKLFFLPHMGGMVCPNNSNLRGAFLGLTWRHKKEHLYRALLESVAYEYAIYMGIEKSLIPELEIKEARVIGGGGKSKFWNQIKSDVLCIPYIRLERKEFGVFGSAILAGYASGLFSDMRNIANEFNRIAYVTEPDIKNHEFYKNYVKFYSYFKSCSELLFNKLSNFN